MCIYIYIYTYMHEQVSRGYIYIYICIHIYIYIYSFGRRAAVQLRTPNPPTNIVDFRGFDSSIILIVRGGIPRPIGKFPESLSQATLVGIMLVGRLGVSHVRSNKGSCASTGIVPLYIYIYIYIHIHTDRYTSLSLHIYIYIYNCYYYHYHYYYHWALRFPSWYDVL